LLQFLPALFPLAILFVLSSPFLVLPHFPLLRLLLILNVPMLCLLWLLLLVLFLSWFWLQPMWVSLLLLLFHQSHLWPLLVLLKILLLVRT
jgi:hypothetical protein